MGTPRDLMSRPTFLASTAGLVIAAWTLGLGEPAVGTEDLFAAMAVQRPAVSGPAPELVLPSLDGRTVDIKDFQGKVVLLGFFTTT